MARFVWLLAPTPEVPQAQVGANALVSDDSASGVGRRVDIEALKDLQIFGRVDEEAAEADAGFDAAPGIEDEAVDTQLRLKLQGIVDSNTEGGGRAVIANGSEQAMYAPGDKLPEGHNVTLEKVLPSRVILNNNGRYESLWLYEKGDFAVAHNPGDETEPPERSWQGDDALAEEDVGPEENIEPEQAVEQVSRSVSDVVSMSVHRENGQIAGYAIRPGQDRDTFEALGLESGDIVKAVNGTELTSPQKVMELYRNVGDASSVSLLIERDGQEVSIDIDLE